MEITFLRHGQTDANNAHRFQGSSESLNDAGIKQAQRAAECLSGKRFGTVLCGRSLRTRQTAEIVRPSLSGKPFFSIRHALDEIDFGILTGLTFDEAYRLHHDVALEYIGSWPHFTFPKGHRFFSFYMRSRDFFYWLLNRPQRGPYLVIASEGPIMAMINVHLGHTPEHMFETRIGNGATITIHAGSA